MTEQQILFLLASSQRALLGAITPNVRLITIKCDELKDLYFRVYYDTPPSEENMEDMEAVITEIIADIPFERDHGAECIYDTRPRNQLELYKWTIYSRKE